MSNTAPEIRFPETWSDEERPAREALVRYVLDYCQKTAADPLGELETVLGVLEGEFVDRCIRDRLLSGDPYEIRVALEEAARREYDVADLAEWFKGAKPDWTKPGRSGS